MSKHKPSKKRDRVRASAKGEKRKPRPVWSISLKAEMKKAGLSPPAFAKLFRPRVSERVVWWWRAGKHTPDETHSRRIKAILPDWTPPERSGKKPGGRKKDDDRPLSRMTLRRRRQRAALERKRRPRAAKRPEASAPKLDE